MTRELSKTHRDKLEQHKKMVEDWHDYFRNNNERYWEFTRFVCASALTSADIAALNTLNKPVVEFNILEAMVSRLRSDFAKQEPSFEVRAADGVSVEMLTEEFVNTEEVLEGCIRAIFNDATNDGLQSNIHTDQLIGGFSAVWVRTDYVSDMSFEQNIIVERVFDPTLTFFDPVARTSHKGDGKYCGMLLPFTKQKFVEQYGEEAARDIKFNKTDALQGFSWSYKSENIEVVLVAYLFEKKIKKDKIVKLSNGHVITKDQYKKLLEKWDLIEQPPIILEERETQFETVVHYQFCENKELHYSETDYKYLPIIFVDGNSVLVRGESTTSQTGSAADSSGGATQQMTRPYVYHAKDAQSAKNFAGQTILAEIQGMVAHKFMASIESIPEDYLETYKRPQEANILLYNAFDDKSGERLDAPREIQRTATPPIVETTFIGSDSVIQTTLGSYDAQQGITGDELSGKAIMQGAIQSDGAAGPYLINYIKAWNRIGQVVLDLIPKYYRTPRSLPIVKKDGKRGFQIINNDQHPESISMNYDPNSFQIKIEAGVSSAVQKQLALETIVRMMSASELFAQFINSEGLEILLDNIDIRNIDSLKLKAAGFMEQLKEQQAMAAQQPNPQEMEMQTIQNIEMAKVQQRQQQAEGELSIKAAQVAVEREKTNIEFARLLAEIEGEAQKMAGERAKADAEEAKAAVDLAIEVARLHNEGRVAHEAVEQGD